MTDMLQKNENVAKNVANKNSQDLTEQWEKRTLRNGAYYIKMLGGDILPAFCNTEYILKQFQTMKGIYDNVAEVLAPVPSYDELQNMNKAVNECMAANIKLVEENARLKELLKELELWFTGVVGNMNDKNVGEHNKSVPIGNFEYIFKEFSQKIKEVLK